MFFYLLQCSYANGADSCGCSFRGLGMRIVRKVCGDAVLMRKDSLRFGEDGTVYGRNK